MKMTKNQYFLPLKQTIQNGAQSWTLTQGNPDEVTLTNGVIVRWDGVNKAEVDVPSGMSACGLCGSPTAMGKDLTQGPNVGTLRKRAVNCPGQVASGTAGGQVNITIVRYQ